MIKRIATVATTAIACVITSQARTVTLDECAAMARENYPVVAQYGIAEATRDFTLSNASRAWLPQVALTAKATWQNTVPELPSQLTALMKQMGVDYPGMKHLQYGAALELNQTVWDGGATAARRAEARAQANVSARATDLTLYEVEGRVHDIYFATLLLHRQCRQLQVTEALLDSTLTQMNAMVSNGVAMQADADEVEAQLLGCRQNITSMLAHADAYRRVLALYTGLTDTDIELSEPDANPPASHTTKPQNALFDSQLRAIDARRKAADAAVMPRFGAMATASYGYPGMNMFQSMRSGRPDFGFLAGINLRWDINAFYTRSNTHRLLDAQSRQIDTDRATAEFNTRLAAESIDGEIRALRAVVADDRRITELRTKVRRAAEAQLTEGVIDTNALLHKIAAETSARMSMHIHHIQLLQQVYKHSHTVNK